MLSYLQNFSVLIRIFVDTATYRICKRMHAQAIVL